MVLFMLLLIIWCGKTCDNSILVSNVAIIAVTHSEDYADTDDSHRACINHVCHTLPDLAGDDYLKHKGDWFNMGNWNGWRICDIYDFRFEQNGNDGWYIAKATVLIRGNNQRVYVPVFQTSLNQWIDGDGHSTHLQSNNLIQGGWRNELQSISTTVNVQNVYLLAETGHITDADSDTEHKLKMYFSGTWIEASNADLPGDDMMKHKSDWWTFSSQFDIINVNDITGISIRAGGHDGWALHDVAVIIQTNYGWYVPVMMTDMYSPNYFIQNDNGSGDMEKSLDMLANWKGVPFVGFTETIGYWKVQMTGNGNEDSLTYSEWEGFEESIATEEEQMEAFSEEISEEMGVSVTVGGEFAGLSAEGQWHYTLGHTVGKEVANTIRNAVESTISSGYEISCTFMNPIPGEMFTLWVWYTYRKSNLENHGGTLMTCHGHFKTGANRNTPPNCIPGKCLDNECMSCISSDWVIDASVTSGGESPCHVEHWLSQSNGAGEPGWDCCTSSSPCGHMEGDCDNDNHCIDDLVCVHNIGNNYNNADYSLDLCMDPALDRRALTGKRIISNEEKTIAVRARKF